MTNCTKSILTLLLFILLASPVRATAQDDECSDDKNEQLMNYSLYYEAFKNKDFQTSLPYLQWILRCAPGFTGKPPGDDRNFRRGVELYHGLAEAADDPAMKEAYMDSALALHDRAVPTLEDAGAEVDVHQWQFRKGRFIQANAELLPDEQNQVGELYLAVYEGNSEILNPLSYYVNVIIADMARNDMKQEAVDFMEDIESNYSGDEEVMQIVDSWRDRLFDSPEERMAFLEDQLDKNAGDLDIIEELIDIYKELEMREKLSGMIAEMLTINPTPKLYVEAGSMKLNDGNIDGAIEDFNKALEMEGGDSVAREANFNLGTALRQKGNLSQARTYYRRALREDPDFTQVYSEIANLYAEAVRECGGSTMEREDRAVYWLVADYHERAGNARGAAQYKPYFPTAEDLFFKGWNEGDEYPINYGCYSWINETTKVRKP